MAFVVILAIFISAIVTEKMVFNQMKKSVLRDFGNDVLIIENKIKNLGDNLSQKASLVGELPIMAYVVEDGDVMTIKDSSKKYLDQLELDALDIYDIESEFLSHVEKGVIALHKPNLEELAIAMYGELAGYQVFEYAGKSSVISYAMIGNINDPVGTIFMVKHLSDTWLNSWNNELFSTIQVIGKLDNVSYGKELSSKEYTNSFKEGDCCFTMPLFELVSPSKLDISTPILFANACCCEAGNFLNCSICA